MGILLYVVVAVVAGLALFLWLRLRSPRPEFPPLEVGNDHPKIRAAVDQARERIDEFQRHVADAPERCIVKFALTTSSEAIEHVWAEVVEVDWPRLQVRLVTPPVTHQGRMERLREITAEEIEDWQAILEDGQIRGGFTQRAMYHIAREQWGELPPDLAEAEKHYRDEPTPG
jgi:uncharacterized protein YegJ (DUF2314 family)